jgi:hypothetical protein
MSSNLFGEATNNMQGAHEEGKMRKMKRHTMSEILYAIDVTQHNTPYEKKTRKNEFASPRLV